MSATSLNIHGTEFVNHAPLTSNWPPGALARIGVKASPQTCPSCGSIVYTRRHKSCGACGANLPTECLFTPDEAERVGALLRLERQRHKEWLRKTAA